MLGVVVLPNFPTDGRTTDERTTNEKKSDEKVRTKKNSDEKKITKKNFGRKKIQSKQFSDEKKLGARHGRCGGEARVINGDSWGAKPPRPPRGARHG